MRNIGAIAKITFLEGLRSRLFFALFIVALLVFSGTYTLSYLFPRDVVKVAVDLSLGTTSLIGLILTLFLGTQLLAKDLEKRTIHMVLAKAVSRSEYVIGKFTGLSAMIVCSVALLGGFAALAAWTVDLLTSDAYGVMHWPLFVLSVAAIALMLVLLVSIIFFFSSFASSTFLALGLTSVVYLIGQSVEELKEFLTQGAEGVAVSPVFLKIVTVAYYIFPNLAALNFKTQAAHGLAVPAATIVYAFLYAILYTAIMISAAAWIFRRREFP
ncbi:MAG TPA: ABC transporter permease subunit [Methylomirabilota bacterium]|nr:ABC transporter permease subunit [Methylomirabilota bacterium]